MKSILREKFQTTAPEPPASPSNWVSDASARRAKFDDRQRVGPGHLNGRVLNELPPGPDISDQNLSRTKDLPRVMSGETDASRDWNREAVENGYKRLPMRPTDDQYTGEHRDGFYDEMTVDGETGFVERSNVLDRM